MYIKFGLLEKIWDRRRTNRLFSYRILLCNSQLAKLQFLETESKVSLYLFELTV